MRTTAKPRAASDCLLEFWFDTTLVLRFELVPVSTCICSSLPLTLTRFICHHRAEILFGRWRPSVVSGTHFRRNLQGREFFNAASCNSGERVLRMLPHCSA